MTFPTVTEITPRMEPVTPDPFLAGDQPRRADLRGAPADAIVSRLQAKHAVAA